MKKLLILIFLLIFWGAGGESIPFSEFGRAARAELHFGRPSELGLTPPPASDQGKNKGYTGVSNSKGPVHRAVDRTAWSIWQWTIWIVVGALLLFFAPFWIPIALGILFGALILVPVVVGGLVALILPGTRPALGGAMTSVRNVFATLLGWMTGFAGWLNRNRRILPWIGRLFGALSRGAAALLGFMMWPFRTIFAFVFR